MNLLHTSKILFEVVRRLSPTDAAVPTLKICQVLPTSLLQQDSSLDQRTSATQSTRVQHKHTFDGPLLAEAPYPDIIAAKAWSHDGTDLDLVLYPGQDGATPRVKLSLERLKKGGRYSISQGDSTQNFVADGQGSAIVDVLVRGRTPVMIQSVF